MEAINTEAKSQILNNLKTYAPYINEWCNGFLCSKKHRTPRGIQFGYNNMVDFFSNDANYPFINKVINNIMPVFSATRKPNDAGDKGDDYVENGVLDFYAYCLYVKILGLPNKTSSCRTVKSLFNNAVFEQEITNINSQRSLGGIDDKLFNAYQKAINYLRNQYQLWYSTSNCDKVIADEDKAAQQQQQLQQEQQTQQITAQNLAQYGSQIVGSGAAAGTNYAIYIVGGVLAISALIIIFKK